MNSDESTNHELIPLYCVYLCAIKCNYILDLKLLKLKTPLWYSRLSHWAMICIFIFLNYEPVHCVRAKQWSCCKVFLKSGESDLASYSKAECEQRLQLTSSFSKMWYNNVILTQTAGCPVEASETKPKNTMQPRLTLFKKPLLGIKLLTGACLAWNLKQPLCFHVLWFAANDSKNVFSDWISCFWTVCSHVSFCVFLWM